MDGGLHFSWIRPRKKKYNGSLMILPRATLSLKRKRMSTGRRCCWSRGATPLARPRSLAIFRPAGYIFGVSLPAYRLSLCRVQ